MEVKKLDNLGGKAQEKAIKMKSEGMSYSAIADELNKEFLSSLTDNDVRSFLRRHDDAAFKLMKESKNFKVKMAKHYFDTLEKVNELCDEMWKLFYDMKDNPEYTQKVFFCKKCGASNNVNIPNRSTLVKIAEHLLNQIKHVDAVLGRMQKKQLNITYNFTELTAKLQKIMPEIYARDERKGLIKIKQKRKIKKIKEYA